MRPVAVDHADGGIGTVRKRNFHTGLDPVSRTNKPAQPTEFNKVRYAQLFSLDTGLNPVWNAVAGGGGDDDERAVVVGTVPATTAPLPTPSPAVTTVPATAALSLSVAQKLLWLVIPAWTPESSRPRTAIFYGSCRYQRSPPTTALNSVGCAELFVLDSRFRGNDDLRWLPLAMMISSSGRSAPPATGRTCPSPTRPCGCRHHRHRRR